MIIPRFAASVPCYHLEGPYISPGPSRGAHDPTWMRRPDWPEFERLQNAAGKLIASIRAARHSITKNGDQIEIALGFSKDLLSADATGIRHELQRAVNRRPCMAA